MVDTVNAGASQHLERPGEAMLVDRGGAIQPKVDINAESRRSIQGESEITEGVGLLLGKRRRRLKIGDDFPWINIPHCIRFAQYLSRNLGKSGLEIIRFFPSLFDDSADLVKELHGGLGLLKL